MVPVQGYAVRMFAMHGLKPGEQAVISKEARSISGEAGEAGEAEGVCSACNPPLTCRLRFMKDTANDGGAYNKKKLLREVQKQFKNDYCHICSIQFNGPMSLVQHYNMKHATKPEFGCVFCTRDFLSVESLGKHIKDKHSKVLLEDGIPECVYLKKVLQARCGDQEE